MDLKKLAKDLRIYRAKHNLTQRELAEKIGIGRNTIWMLENEEKRTMHDRTIKRLQEAGFKIEGY